MRSIWVRLVLGVLAYTAALALLAWLAQQYWALKRVRLGDAFFLIGVLACAAASAGLMRNPYSEMLSPWGVFRTIQPTEREKYAQRLAELVEARSFGLRLLAAGLIIILLSLFIPITW